ncbi:protein LURP-one-related 17-like isoform X1 [Diospyros lotus]|uniref:protein LURP-one-related 17-like isoform X1 n=1 Tax=Diospyros lotus TaxID=55363 RepID=UPI00224C9EA7|nr:protein LURP-one-related 17-like isoform X1 [Diospyros lotus]
MILFKSSSRSTVVPEQEEDHSGTDDHGDWTSLTVWRKSLLFSCKGFTVIDSNGHLVFRVDNYAGRTQDATLMDGAGHPILTIRRRKKLRLVDNWLVYEGEAGGHGCSTKKPICCMRRRVNILQPSDGAVARVYHGPPEKRQAYVIEGSYSLRCCRVVDESRRRVVAEIKRKEAGKGGVSLGLEVFRLSVRPEINPSFAMAIVMLLDQMYS